MRMTEGELIIALIVIGVIVLVALAVWLLMRQRHTAQLKDRFGDEYDRTVHEHGTRGGEANLQEREKRVSQFDIRPLGRDERDRLSTDWQETKALFVDSPQEAVLRADRLLTAALTSRGYPMGDFDRRYEDLTVDHGNVARHYRAGHDIAVNRNATTEELRQSLNHYEALFTDMMQDDSDQQTEHRGTVTMPQTAPPQSPAPANRT